MTDQDYEPTPEEVLGEAPKPKHLLADPEIRRKAMEQRKLNTAEKKRKAEASRADLSVKFLSDVHELWKEHGPTILARAAFAHPEKIAKIVADLMPKQLEVKGSAVQDLDDERLSELIGAISDRLGRGTEAALGAAEGRAAPKIIDATIIDVSPVREADGVSPRGSEPQRALVHGGEPVGEVAGGGG